MSESTESDMQDDVQVTFKKMKKGKKQLRKVDKRIDTSSDDVKHDQLEEVKLLQKQRVRSKGVATISADVAGVTANGASEPAQEQKIMGQSFQQQETNVNPLQSHMEKYIAEQLAARREGKKQDSKPKERDPNDDSVLYQTPDILKNAKPKEDMVEAGDRWLTGIAEVPLPITDKLKTIEETEKAKEKLFASKMASTGGAVLTIPANYNADFSRHQREYADRRKEQFKANAHANALPVDARETANPKKRHNEGQSGVTATDDRVVQQFMKKHRYH
jgi:hypothetical protein